MSINVKLIKANNHHFIIYTHTHTNKFQIPCDLCRLVPPREIGILLHLNNNNNTFYICTKHQSDIVGDDFKCSKTFIYYWLFSYVIKFHLWSERRRCKQSNRARSNQCTCGYTRRTAKRKKKTKTASAKEELKKKPQHMSTCWMLSGSHWFDMHIIKFMPYDLKDYFALEHKYYHQRACIG